MHRTFYSTNFFNVTSEDESTPNPTSPREDAKRNLVDLTKRLQEAETYLTASRSYLDASAASLDVVKKYMCFSEADIKTATDCVVETEKKLEAIHSQLQSLYHNIFCENSCYGSQYDESESNANKIPTAGAIPSPVLAAMGRYAHMPVDLNAYAVKCYKYRESTFVIMHPKQHAQLRSETDERRDAVGEFRSRRRKIMENFPTVNTNRGNCIRIQEPVNVDQIYEEAEIEWEDSLEQNPGFSMDAPMNDLNLNRKLSGTASEMYHMDDSMFSVGKFHRIPFRTADSKIPSNSRTNAASQNDSNFEDYRSRISSFPMKPVSYEEDSSLKMCCSFGSTTQQKSKQNDGRLRRMARFLENEGYNKQLSKQQTRENYAKHSSKRGLFCETKEREIDEEDTGGNMIQEAFVPESAGTFSETYQSSLSHPKRQERGLEKIYEQSTQNAAGSDEILVKRNIIKPHKKAGMCPPLTKGTTFKDGRRNDQSLKPEGHSNQYFEISLPVGSVATSPKVSRRTTDGYIENLIQTFENNERLENEMTNETASGISGCTSSSKNTISYFLGQDNQSADESRTSNQRPKESISRFIQTETTKKFSENNSMTVTNNSSRKSFLHEKRRNGLSDRENNLDNGSINRLSSDIFLDNADKSNNGVNNKDFNILPFDTVSDNPELLDSNIELASSVNRPIALRNVSTSSNTAFRSHIEKRNQYSCNQKETIISNLPVKKRVKETKNSCTINSSQSDSSPPKQPQDGNSCMVHQGNLDSAFQEASKASNCSCEPNEKHFPCKKLFDSDGKDTFVLQYELRASSSTLNRSGIVDAGSECIETSSLLPGSNFVPEQENYGSLNCKSASSEVNGSKQSHSASTCFSMDTQSNDFSNRTRLPLSERDFTCVLSGISSNPFHLQSETTRLLDREDSQETCVGISTRVLPHDSSLKSPSPEISDSNYCFPENLL